MPTAVISFRTKHVRAVRERLEQLGNPAQPKIRDKLDESNVVHFASMSVIETPGRDSFILIELAADGDEDDALAKFVGALSSELADVLQAAGRPAPAEGLTLRLQRLRLGLFSTSGLAFDGCPAMAVNRIRRESDLAAWIEGRADLLAGPKSSVCKLEQIRCALWREGSYKWAFTPEPAPILEAAPVDQTTLGKIVIGLQVARRMLIWPFPVIPLVFAAMLWLRPAGDRIGGLIWSLIDALALVGAVIALAGVLFAVALRRREQADRDPDAKPDVEVLKQVLRTENASIQNILMTTSEMKDGCFRRACLSLAFFVIRTLLPLAWAPGRLGDLDDIHFARWVLLPGTNLLVFRSHYDGSWLRYLHDFVLGAPEGVTLIWSNTKDFPHTRWLMLDGAADGPRFLQWARVQTTPAPFWYSAYPDLSMVRIRLNACIARGIATGTADAELAGWLASLGAGTPGRA